MTKGRFESKSGGFSPCIPDTCHLSYANGFPAGISSFYFLSSVWDIRD
uniref:Uncharacterized protein n=1 Tax=Rhizophora mucronata TaxID=61149 RepID=A0A2P2NBJ5_RHIMU